MTVIVAVVVERKAKDKRMPRGVTRFKQTLAYRVQNASITSSVAAEEKWIGEYLETQSESVGDSSMRNS